MNWILLGILFVLCVRNHFKPQGVANDIRKITKSVRKTIRDLVRSIRHTVKNEKKEAAEHHKTAPEQNSVANTTRQSTEILKDLEQTARTAAMMVNVPTINFPKDDPKYDSSKKYRYA